MQNAIKLIKSKSNWIKTKIVSNKKVSIALGVLILLLVTGMFVSSRFIFPHMRLLDAAENYKPYLNDMVVSYEGLDRDGNTVYGYKTTSGKVLIEPKYEAGGEFTPNGLALIYEYDHEKNEGSNYRYIDIEGKVALFWNTGASSFRNDGYAEVWKKDAEGNYRTGLINSKGELVIGYDFGTIGIVNGKMPIAATLPDEDFSDQFYGYINLEGDTLIDYQFDRVTNFDDNGYAVIQEDRGWELIIIDVNGKRMFGGKPFDCYVDGSEIDYNSLPDDFDDDFNVTNYKFIADGERFFYSISATGDIIKTEMPPEFTWLGDPNIVSSENPNSGSDSDAGGYYCMGKNDTCPNKTSSPYDLYCNSCDPDGDGVEN